MLVTADQILAHLIGDYILQSDWMATEKTKKLWVAYVHAMAYAIPFVFLVNWGREHPIALIVIIVSHAVIDHWRLARYLNWIKNFLSPMRTLSDDTYTFRNGWAFSKGRDATGERIPMDTGDTVSSAGTLFLVLSPPEADGSMQARPFTRWRWPWSECVATGYHKDRPAWLAVWLMIITDNALHILINALAIKYL